MKEKILEIITTCELCEHYWEECTHDEHAANKILEEIRKSLPEKKLTHGNGGKEYDSEEEECDCIQHTLGDKCLKVGDEAINPFSHFNETIEKRFIPPPQPKIEKIDLPETEWILSDLLINKINEIINYINNEKILS